MIWSDLHKITHQAHSSAERKALSFPQRLEFFNLLAARCELQTLVKPEKGEAPAVSLFNMDLIFFTKESSELSLLSAC